MEFAPLMLALYGSTALGLLIGVYRAMFTVSNQINIGVFATYVCKLVRAGNTERSIKLCAAAPKALFTQIVRPALEAVVAEQSDDQQLRARRFEQVAEASYERVLEQDKYGPLLSYAALLLGVGPILAAVALKTPITPVLAILGGLPAALGLWSASASRKLRNDSRPALARIATALRSS